MRLTLSATPSQTNRRVSWNADTIDNEHLNKKKSKCVYCQLELPHVFDCFLLVRLLLILGCCIYKKPRQFGESSSESDDDECDNCFGHVEKKKKNRRPPPSGDHPHDEHDEHDHHHDHSDRDGGPSSQPTAGN